MDPQPRTSIEFVGRRSLILSRLLSDLVLSCLVSSCTVLSAVFPEDGSATLSTTPPRFFRSLVCSLQAAAPQQRDSNNATPPIPLPPPTAYPTSPLKRLSPTQSTIRRHHRNVPRKSVGRSDGGWAGTGTSVWRKKTAAGIGFRRRRVAVGEQISQQMGGVTRSVSRGMLKALARGTRRGRWRWKVHILRDTPRVWEKRRCCLRR